VSIAVVPGTFDPITLGHRDIIRRARGLFDEVVVAVSARRDKHPLLSIEERVVLVEQAVADLTGVRVMAAPGLLVDFCHQVGATAIVKGLRGATDLSGEVPQALMNQHLGEIETVFLTSKPEYGFISSTIVKEVVANGGNVAKYVPAGVPEAVTEALATRHDAVR